MELDHIHRYCYRCGRQQLHYRRGVNHVFHLLVTVLTCGLWGWVWFMLCLRIGGWRCKECGYGGRLWPKLLFAGVGIAATTAFLLVIVLSWPTAPATPVGQQLHLTDPPDSVVESSDGVDGAVAVQDGVGEASIETAPVDTETFVAEWPIEETTDQIVDAEEPVDAPAAATPAEKSSWRVWTDSSGAFSVEAEFRGMAFGRVKLLRRDNGKVVEIDLSQLSPADQAWIAARSR